MADWYSRLHLKHICLEESHQYCVRGTAGWSWLNRLDVQAAINAPVGTVWQQCTNIEVFPPDGDQSLDPTEDGMLQHVIEFYQ
jgi:hypothetical protein